MVSTRRSQVVPNSPGMSSSSQRRRKNKKSIADDDEEEEVVLGTEEYDRIRDTQQEEEEGDVDELMSSVQQNGRGKKRGRTRNMKYIPATQQDDEDDEDDGDGNSSVHDSDKEDEEEELRATAAKRRKNSSPKKKAVADDDESDDEKDHSIHEPGIVEHMRLENFMCHDLLEVDFCNHVNIITGANGSGKSAILSGLQVALGAKAGSTHRGSKIRDMIKTDRQYAIATVRLRNRGPDAYKPDIYGKSIIVERVLSKTGSGGYKLKNAKGKTVSTQLRDLKTILNQFNIQIDNPTTVMTQDVSRKFLAESKNDAKYNFFLNSTQVQEVINHISGTKNKKDGIERVIEGHRENMAESKKQLDILKAEADEAEKMEGMERKMDSLDHELSWATVIKFERRIADLRSNLERESKKLQEAREGENEGREENDEIEAERLSVLRQIDDLTAQLTNLIDGSRDASEQLQVERRKMRMLQGNVNNTYAKRIKSNQQYIRTKQRELEELQNTERKNYEKELEELNSKIQEQENLLAQEEADYNSVRDDLRKMQDEISTIDAQLRELSHQRNHGRDDIGSIEHRIRGIEEAKSDRLKLIHANVPRLLKAIEQRRDLFHMVPLGPIGHMIKLRDNKWGKAAEHSLRHSLISFFVHDNHDHQLLKDILKRQGLSFMSSVISSFKDRKYNVEKPRGDVLVLSDIIETDWEFIQSSPLRYEASLNRATIDSTIFNLLVDQNYIERQVLMDTRNECDRYLTSYRPSADCFTLKGEKLSYRGATKITTSFQGNQRFFVQNVQVEIDGMLQAKQEKQERVAQIDEQIRNVRAQLDAKKREYGKLRRTLEDHHRRKSHCENSIGDLQNSIATLRQAQQQEEQDTVAQNIRDKIQEKKEEIAVFEEKSREAQAQIDELMTTVAELETSTQGFDSKRGALQKENDLLSEKMTVILKRQMAHRSKETQMRGMVQRIQENITLMEQTILEEANKHREYLEVAKRMHPERIETSRTAEQIAREKERISIRVDAERQRFEGRSVQDVKQAYHDFRRPYQENEKMIEKCQELFESIKNSLNSRFSNMRKIRSTCEKTVNTAFNNYLSQRSHTGRVVFDHDNSTLDLHINLDSATQNNKAGKQSTVRDVKSLSGGEKSYSTVSFLLALWEVVESPFRALDEFDIFMDSLYRRTSMELLIRTALSRHSKRQLLILTPHDTSFIKASDQVKIIQLRNPERSGFQTSIHSYLAA